MSALSIHPAHGRVTRTRSPTVSAHQTAAWYGSTPFLRRRIDVLASLRVTVAPFLLRIAAKMPVNGCGMVAPPTLRPSMVQAWCGRVAAFVCGPFVQNTPFSTSDGAYEKVVQEVYLSLESSPSAAVCEAKPANERH